MTHPILEVCVEDLEGARIAHVSGADRIELCQDLRFDGITPSPELIERVRSLVPIPLIVLIRYRIGDFVYSKIESAIMLDQAKRALELGADGVAVGACNRDGSLDWTFLEKISHQVRSTCNQAQLVLHRVFDSVPEKQDAVAKLIALGFDRLLTSGGAARAIDSLPELAELQSLHGDKIEVLPAGGIHSSTAQQILTISRCWQLHGSMRDAHDPSIHRGPCPHQISDVKRILRGSQI
jgi:copper homeostasis protein